MKKSVWVNQAGFTLIEAMLSMIILTVIMSVVPLIFSAFTAIDRSVAVEEDYEWNLFLIQLRNELKNNDGNLVNDIRLIILKGQNVIYYEKYGSTIRRRVNKMGHEIVLQNVGDMDFSNKDGSIVLTVYFINGVVEEAFFPMTEMEEGEISVMKMVLYTPLL